MKYLRILLCIALVISCCNLYAAPGLATIQKRIASAGELWSSDPAGAQKILNAAFADAISWTTAEYVDRVREQAFFAAITCYSPDLLDEVASAADTYIQVFPKGRNIRKVHLYRAMAAWAVQDQETAEKSLNAASALGKLSYPEQSQILTGHLSAGKHRTAERFIEGQRISRPSRRLTRDLRRFHSGNRLVEGVLKRLKDGKIAGSKAVEILEEAVDKAWFAKRAPEAALTSINLRDAQAPYFNSIITEWCGLERVVKHASSPQIRLLKLEKFLAGFPEADPDELYRALIDLRYLQEYEFKNTEAAMKALEQLKSIPELAAQAEMETLVSGLNPARIITKEGNADILRLLSMPDRLPYDNGHLPSVTREHLEFMLAIGNMVLDRYDTIETFTCKGWRGLPVDMLYLNASGKKEKAYGRYQAVRSSLTPPVCRMIEDVLLPLYRPMKAKDRIFLAGLASVEMFPDLGTDLLIEAVSGNPRMYKAEHGLAVIADVYNRHMANAEAQSVWNLLGKLYPDSIWLK